MEEKEQKNIQAGNSESVFPSSVELQPSTLKLSDFDFQLPQELIAAFPPQDRPSARLLSANKTTGQLSHHQFREIINFLKAGDLLVLNNTKVRPARIFGAKDTGGRVEALLLKEVAPGEWEALVRPGGRIKKGMWITFGENGVELPAEVLDEARPDTGERRIRFFGEKIAEKLKVIGHIPLPPYLDRPDTELDREMYQTVFAKEEGAVASPTAGLHFDKPLLADLEKKGVEIAYVTLHVSYGTFQPVTEEDLYKHEMFSEEFEVTQEAAEKVNRALNEKRRIIACGTTSVRTLESAVVKGGRSKVEGRGENQTEIRMPSTLHRPSSTVVQAGSGTTQLFIYPPYEFKVVSGMITNFHLPKSSLLLLVAAFLGKDRMLHAYEEAIKQNYHFYSYGDAMLIL